MFLPLPKLDDRRWIDLIDEGRALIPQYAPAWTDHNAHDPGMTLMELFAWLADMDLYQLDRITSLHKQKFLHLAGIVLRPPAAARTLVTFTLADGQPSVDLPAGIELEGEDSAKQILPFRTLQEMTVAPGQLAAVFVENQNGMVDLAARFLIGEAFDLFGSPSQVGANMYLGFSQPLSINKPVKLYFKLASSRTDEAERQRLQQERRRWGQQNSSAAPARAPEEAEIVLSHHSVRTVWEFWGEQEGGSRWIALQPQRNEIRDNTRSFTLDGEVTLRLPTGMSARTLGRSKISYYFLRCRYLAGDYDAPPRLQRAWLNAATVEQAVPVGREWKIAANAQIIGVAPAAGERVALRLQFNQIGYISLLEFIATPAAGLPRFLIRRYLPPAPGSIGVLELEAVFLGAGNGMALQHFNLPQAPIEQGRLRVYSLEGEQWREWQVRPGFLASSRTDSHFTVDPESGDLVFGDGEKGRVVPDGGLMFAVYRSTRHEQGNLRPGQITRVADSAHNRAFLGSPLEFGRKFAALTNPIAATGGAATESLAAAEGRAFMAVTENQRLLTLADIERMTLQTPGARIARATAKVNLHPSYSCFKAPGFITVIVMPDMPVPQPMPSAGLLRAVWCHLHPWRIIGSRLEVAGPAYIEIRVQTRVRALARTDRARVQAEIMAALRRFLDPRAGGSEGTGWPFGRDVFRSEILHVIDAVDGVDYVEDLQLYANDGAPQCGNICIGPLGLPTSGEHSIEVI